MNENEIEHEDNIDAKTNDFSIEETNESNDENQSIKSQAISDSQAFWFILKSTLTKSMK